MTETWIIVCEDCEGPRFEPEAFTRAVKIKNRHVERKRHDCRIERKEAVEA